MHILNLGAGGFIGSHLTQRLLSEGHSVTAVDLWQEKVADLLANPRLKFVQQDIREPGWNLDPLVQQ
ncbi:MAG TPA: NAD-dependent epimerase/dehydratase family protein, partial [Candidatus Solibacter sp.]|nr:NAD-dependent epimerase/dehydratase family protein [Candidatus Solibacter sp.]